MDIEYTSLQTASKDRCRYFKLIYFKKYENLREYLRKAEVSKTFTFSK